MKMDNLFNQQLQQSTTTTPPTSTTTTTTKSPKDTQISFEIPTHRDLQHIESLQKQRQHKYSRLLGNVPYDTISASRDHSKLPTMPTIPPKSVVLNVAHEEPTTILSARTTIGSGVNSNGGIDRMFFADADMHTFINVLWIGVVSALIVLSIVFIVLSVYFYRKFRVWKQCHRHNYSAGGQATTTTTTTSMSSMANNGQLFFAMPYNSGAYRGNISDNMSNWSGGSILCNMPPPCYTIATGLPTYAEALNRHIYGSKFVYPTIMPPHLFEQQQLFMTTTDSGNGSSSGEQLNDKVCHHQHDSENNSTPMTTTTTTTTIHYIKPIFTMESSVESKDVVMPLLQNSTPQPQPQYPHKDDVCIV